MGREEKDVQALRDVVYTVCSSQGSIEREYSIVDFRVLW